MNDLLQRAQTSGTPFIDGEQVTWVWFGDTQPGLIGDFTNWDEDAPILLSEKSSGVWTVTRTFEPDAYLEYMFLLDGERVNDPYNLRSTWNGIDSQNNWFRMPQNVRSPYLVRTGGIPHGKVIREAVPLGELVAGGIREVFFYKPPTDEPVPYIGVFDGNDYLRRASLANVVDNLIAQKKIRPVALIMVANGGQARMLEYFAHDLTMYMLAEPLADAARKHMTLIDAADEPGIHGVIGASMGGLMALHAGIRVPDVFGHVIAQSSAVQFEFKNHRIVLWDMVQWADALPKIWLDVGKYEWLLTANRKFHDLLKSKNAQVQYREYNAGHNYTIWADQLADALIYHYGL